MIMIIIVNTMINDYEPIMIDKGDKMKRMV